jgi:hypothetical protein
VKHEQTGGEDPGQTSGRGKPGVMRTNIYGAHG